MRQRSKPISRIRGGTKTTNRLRSQRPPSLEPALSRSRLQTASAATRLSVAQGFYRLSAGSHQPGPRPPERPECPRADFPDPSCPAETAASKRRIPPSDRCCDQLRHRLRRGQPSRTGETQYAGALQLLLMRAQCRYYLLPVHTLHSLPIPTPGSGRLLAPYI